MRETTRIGTTVAGYRIDSVLGRGGMSVVYLAEHLRLGRKVALKVLAPALAEDEGFRDRFTRESRRAAELDHPNVIPIYDAGEDGEGLLYIAMRYVEGRDLRSVLNEDGAQNPGRAFFILEQVASALDAAHDRDLIHRDVKPPNILIAEPSDHVYLTDFGVVKHTATRGVTQTGFFVGTLEYAAPEQIEGRPADPRTDVYALGCVLYETLVGKPPFERDSDVALMHAHLSAPPPRVTDARPDLPKGLDRVVATAMAKATEERFPRCPELVEAARAAVLRRPSGAQRTVEPDVPDASRVGGGPVLDRDGAGSSELAPPGLPYGAGDDGAASAVPVRRPRPRWLTTAALVAAAAAISAGAMFAVTRDDSDSRAGSPARSPAGVAAGLPRNTGLELQDLVPPPLWTHCSLEPVTQGSAIEHAVCLPPDEPGTAFFPDRWEISTFPNAAALRTAYDAERERRGVAPGRGRCTGTSWGGEGAWMHGPDKPGGSRFCFFDGEDAVIVWTHARLGQETHQDVLAVAREGGSDHTGLFGWWNFWHHRIGKAGS